MSDNKRESSPNLEEVRRDLHKNTGFEQGIEPQIEHQSEMENISVLPPISEADSPVTHFASDKSDHSRKSKKRKNTTSESHQENRLLSKGEVIRNHLKDLKTILNRNTNFYDAKKSFSEIKEEFQVSISEYA